MSVISLRETVAAGTTSIYYLQLARPFIRAATFNIFSPAPLTAQVRLRATSNGVNIFPIPTRGGQVDIALDNHAPYRFEVNKEVAGPPYELALTVVNDDAINPVIVTAIFEVYNTPYPQTRVHQPTGHGPGTPAGETYEEPKIE